MHSQHSMYLSHQNRPKGPRPRFGQYVLALILLGAIAFCCEKAAHVAETRCPACVAQIECTTDAECFDLHRHDMYGDETADEELSREEQEAIELYERFPELQDGWDDEK
jgi:hypothetical protein